jgi:hypothetical protein
MKDLIWTLIIVWLVYRLFTLFRVTPGKNSSRDWGKEPTGPVPPPSKNDQARKEALQKHLNSEGEYVDYEDLK